jgi:hypothetical protein
MQRGDIAKIVISVLLFLFLLFVSVQIYTYHIRAGEAKANYNSAKERYDAVERDHATLADELLYYSNPLNLEKELRARLNYHAPGEKTIILVPKASSTSN